MERNFFSEGFEGFLREKADQYKMYPSDRVWKNIDRELRPRRKWPYMAAVLLLLGIGIGAKYYVNDRESGNMEQSMPSGGQGKELKVASLNPAAGTETHAASTTPAKTRNNPLRVVARTQKVTAHQPEKPVVDALELPAGDDAGTTGTIPSLNAAAGVNAEQALPNLRPHAPLIDIRPNVPLKTPESDPTVKPEQYTVNPIVPANVFTPRPRKWSFEMYVTPSVSYRRLTGKASTASYTAYNNIGYSANFGYPSDVNSAVVHKPSVGIELGSALSYPISKTFRFKAGLQLNYNQYLIQAYSYVPEMASFSANSGSFYTPPVNEVSFYRNFNGYSRTWLKNEHFMISMPIGFDMNLAGREDRVQFGITSTIQPTFVLSDNAYLISTNLKNYAEATALYRNWNVNGAVGAFLSVNTGPVKWVLGPQFRYQMFSSYSDNYPIREHLVEYGFKIGVKKSIH